MTIKEHKTGGLKYKVLVFQPYGLTVNQLNRGQR